MAKAKKKKTKNTTLRGSAEEEAAVNHLMEQKNLFHIKENTEDVIKVKGSKLCPPDFLPQLNAAVLFFRSEQKQEAELLCNISLDGVNLFVTRPPLTDFEEIVPG